MYGKQIIITLIFLVATLGFTEALARQASTPEQKIAHQVSLMNSGIKKSQSLRQKLSFVKRFKNYIDRKAIHYRDRSDPDHDRALGMMAFGYQTYFESIPTVRFSLKKDCSNSRHEIKLGFSPAFKRPDAVPVEAQDALNTLKLICQNRKS